jgi:hypothetical protein
VTFALSYAAMALILVGLRIAVSLPTDLRAAWIVPMIDAPGYILRTGLWRALFATGVLPVVAVFAAVHAWFWDARLALVHAGVMLAVGTLLVEAALWHFDDLPGRRPWRPDNANLRFWWPGYLFGFLMITISLPRFEWWARDSLVAQGIVACVCLAAAIAVRIAHRRPYPLPSFEIETFVEPPRVLRLD